MSPAIKCLILLAIVALFFVTELIPLAVTAVGAAIASGLLGLIPAKQVFSGLSNSTVVLFAGMFVVGASMFYTGLAQEIGGVVVKMCGTGENSLMFGLMIVGTVLSAVLSNTGTAACLLPVALGICSAAKIPASRQLMPLAFACGWGWYYHHGWYSSEYHCNWCNERCRSGTFRLLRIRLDWCSYLHCWYAVHDVLR